MSTRSLIAKKISEDKYLTIYCHSDGYLTYNGALLLDHYNSTEQVDKLLALGDISYLAERLEPDPSSPHSFDYDKRQEGVTLASGRDRGEKGTEAVPRKNPGAGSGRQAGDGSGLRLAGRRGE